MSKTKEKLDTFELTGEDEEFIMDGDESFDELQREFSELMKDMSEDKILQSFKGEFQHLMDALKKSRQSEMKLTWRCREMNSELAINAAKIKQALKATQADQNTINQLRTEVDKSWKMLTVQLDKEKEMKSTIAALNGEMEKLTLLIEDANEKNASAEEIFNNLTAEKVATAEERDNLNKQLVEVTRELYDKGQEAERLEASKRDMQQELETLKKIAGVRKNEIEHEKKKRQMMEREITELRSLIDRLEEEAKRKTDQIENNESYLGELQRRLKLDKADNSTLSKRLELMESQLRTAKSDLQKAERDSSLARVKSQKAESSLKTLQEEAVELKKSLKNALFTKETLDKKLIDQEKELNKAQEDNSQKKVKLATLEMESEALMREMKSCERSKREFESEREVLLRKVNDMTSECKRLEDILHVRETSYKSLEKELTEINGQNARYKTQIQTLEKEKLLKGDEVARAMEKYIAKGEVVKEKELKLLGLSTTLKEEEDRHAKEHARAEVLEREKNSLLHHFSEKENEVMEMNQNFQLLQEELKALEHAIKSKEAQNEREKASQDTMRKEKDELVREHTKLKEKVRQAEDKIRLHKLQIQRTISENKKMEEEATESTREKERLTSTKDSLQRELVQKRMDITALSEKIRIQQDVLNTSDTSFREKMSEIKQLQIQLAEAKHAESRLVSSQAELEALKRMNISLESSLSREEAKISALSDELETPINVHRWRKLEGEDPESFKLLRRIHLLQKKLIEKTELAIRQEEMLKEKNKLLIDLRDMLSRKPKIESSKKIMEYSSLLSEKENQRKAMEAEAAMSRKQIKDYEIEIKDLRRELKDITEGYYNLKKKEHKENFASLFMIPEQGNGRGSSGYGSGYERRVPRKMGRIGGNVHRIPLATGGG